MPDFFQNLFAKSSDVQPNAKGLGGMIGGIIGGIGGSFIPIPGVGTAAGGLVGKLAGDALDNNLPLQLMFAPKAEQDRYMNAIRERNKTPEERQAENAQREAQQIQADTDRINRETEALQNPINIGQKQSKMSSGVNDRPGAAQIGGKGGPIGINDRGGKNAAVIGNGKPNMEYAQPQQQYAQQRETLATTAPLQTDTRPAEQMPSKKTTEPFSFTNKWHNLPIWAWCLIGVGTLSAIGTVGYFAFIKK